MNGYLIISVVAVANDGDDSDTAVIIEDTNESFDKWWVVIVIDGDNVNYADDGTAIAAADDVVVMMILLSGYLLNFNYDQPSEGLTKVKIILKLLELHLHHRIYVLCACCPSICPSLSLFVQPISRVHAVTFSYIEKF